MQTEPHRDRVPPMPLNRPSAPAVDNAPPRELISADWRAGFFFSLSVLMLLLTGFALPHGGVSDYYSEIVLKQFWVPLILFGCWLLILADGLVGLLQAPDGPIAAGKRLLLTLLLPPLRLTTSSTLPNRYIWLPRLGWIPTGRESQVMLERRLALPMLLVTLLILPVVGAELLYPEELARAPLAALAVHTTTSLIWASFTFEFVVMVTVAEKKLDYCKKHWINLVIIMLPLVAFLRTLQLFRFLRIAKAGKLLRAYRLRGVFARALRLALMLNLIERVMQRNLDGYIAGLEEKIGEKELELDELRSKLYDARVKQRLRSHR